jgi:hypothetical protein
MAPHADPIAAIVELLHARQRLEVVYTGDSKAFDDAMARHTAALDALFDIVTERAPELAAGLIRESSNPFRNGVSHEA